MMKRLIPALLGLVAGSAMAAASVGKAAPDFTLSDLKFIATEDGARKERMLGSEEEFKAALKEYFNINL